MGAISASMIRRNNASSIRSRRASPRPQRFSGRNPYIVDNKGNLKRIAFMATPFLAV